MEKVPFTPFTIAREHEHWYVLMGKYRLSAPLSKENALFDANNMTWDRILQVIGIMIKEMPNELTTNN